MVCVVEKSLQSLPFNFVFTASQCPLLYCVFLISSDVASGSWLLGDVPCLLQPIRGEFGQQERISRFSDGSSVCARIESDVSYH